MNKRTVVAFCGFPGTGKTTLAERASEEMGFFAFEGSAYLRVLAANEGIILSSRSQFLNYYIRTQRELGQAWLAEAMLKRPEQRLLNTGMRNRADFERIHSAGGTIIGLVCSDEVCLSRIDKTDPKNPQTIEEYRDHKLLEDSGDQAGFGTHVSWILERADVLLDTSQPIEQTMAEFRDLVESARPV